MSQLEDVDKNNCIQNEIFCFVLECLDEYECSENGQFAACGSVHNKQVHDDLFKRLESLKGKYKQNQHAKMTSRFGMTFSLLC